MLWCVLTCVYSTDKTHTHRSIKEILPAGYRVGDKHAVFQLFFGHLFSKQTVLIKIVKTIVQCHVKNLCFEAEVDKDESACC